MSYTSIYEIYKTKAVCFQELGNGHGSGPAIWEYISVKYLGKSFQLFSDLSEFWILWKDPRLTRNERAVLLSTYDNAIVETKHLKEFSEACTELHRKIIDTTDWSWNHFADIGIEASKLNAKHDYRCLGLGIGCTSVSDPWEFWKPGDTETLNVYESIESFEKEFIKNAS